MHCPVLVWSAAFAVFRAFFKQILAHTISREHACVVHCVKRRGARGGGGRMHTHIFYSSISLFICLRIPVFIISY